MFGNGGSQDATSMQDKERTVKFLSFYGGVKKGKPAAKHGLSSCQPIPPPPEGILPKF